MKKFLFYIILSILTFAFGVFIYRISSPNVSMVTLTNYTAFYDGKEIETETYIQVESLNGKYFYLGEPFEKPEAWVYLNTEGTNINLDSLKKQLIVNLSNRHFYRAKVFVKGTVRDNCNKGTTCCFGRTITILAQEVKQLAPVEEYTRPE